MSSLVQLICCCQSGRTGTDDGNFLSGTNLWNMGSGITFFVCRLNDSMLIVSDRYRISPVSTGTCLLTQSRTYTGGKLREIICLVQTVICLLIVSGIKQIVPLRYQIVQRAAGSHSGNCHTRLTERDTAIHTARCLLSLFFFGKEDVEFIKIFDSFLWFHRTRLTSVVFHKSCWLSHCFFPPYALVLA